MPINAAWLAEFDMEMVKTRTTLERIPEDRFGWAPHPKSMKLANLAQHIAEIPGWCVETLTRESLDIPDDYKPTIPTTRAQVLKTFEESVTKGRQALAAAKDEQFGQMWALKAGGKTLFSGPKGGVLRGFVMNHLIHHRAQLGVYLRLNDIPVPSIYGPSADEGQF